MYLYNFIFGYTCVAGVFLFTYFNAVDFDVLYISFDTFSLEIIKTWYS